MVRGLDMRSLNLFAFSLAAIGASVILAAELQDMIRCDQQNSNYQLVLVLKNPQLPRGITAIALKDSTTVVFKVASRMFTVSAEPDAISFIEIPATPSSKLVKLDLQTKVATLLNFSAPNLESGSTFGCQF